MAFYTLFELSNWIGLWTTNRRMHEHVAKRAKKKHRSKESQTGGTKQARQAYQSHAKRRKVCTKHTNTTGVYLTNGHTQSIPGRDGCDHTSTSPWRAQSMAKCRSREANTVIKRKSK